MPLASAIVYRSIQQHEDYIHLNEETQLDKKQNIRFVFNAFYREFSQAFFCSTIFRRRQSKRDRLFRFIYDEFFFFWCSLQHSMRCNCSGFTRRKLKRETREM